MHYNVTNTAADLVSFLAKVLRDKGVVVGLIRPSQLLEI